MTERCQKVLSIKSFRNLTKYKIIALAVCLVLAAAVIPASADGSFALSISVPEGASVGSTVYVTLNISSLPAAVSAFQCELHFDASIAEPVITSSGTNMDSFMAVNGADFEQHCEYRGDGVYFLAFCSKNDGKGETTVASKQDLVIKIPLKIISEGEFDFIIPQSSVLAFDAELGALDTEGCEYGFTALAKQNEFYTALECEEALDKTVTYLTFSVTNKTAADGISAFEIALEYSHDTLVAEITDNTDDLMNSFIVSAPDGWQQMCRHESNGKYRIRLVAPDGGVSQSDCLAIGQTITLSIPFNVVGGEGSKAKFDIPSSECTAYASDLRLLTGIGSSLEKEIGKTPDFEFKDGSVVCADGYITGIPADTAAENAGDYFKGEIYISSNGAYIDGDDIIATGMTAELWYNGQKITSATIIIKGDVTCDGKINISDALLIKRVYFGNNTLDDNAALASKIMTPEGAMPDDYLAIKRYIKGTYTFR